MSTIAVRPLNKHLKTIALEELNEEPDKIQENLEALKDWLKKSLHIKARTNDQFLITFLRGCKYSLDRSKKKIDMYYTLRTHIPELIKDRDPLDRKTSEIIKFGVGLPLPVTESPGSPRLMLIRPGAFDANKFTIQEVMRVNTMVNDILMIEDDNMVVSGQIGIIDLANVTFAHLVQIQPAFVKKLAMMWQESTPIRQKGFHFINIPRGFEQVFNLLKSFMNDKLKSRLFIHSNLDSMYKVIPRGLMPTEYNGDVGSICSLIESWEKKIHSYRQYFLDESNLYGVDEKKRIGQPKNPSSLFGMEGTFRKLQLD
ncbi:Alpha-tocopherol transfer protein-like [Pseudolycoriella hygida]|uniref:Alpha-tocopherol transfer protein-like n=1 Tax=Pseudolycoriella hygida TaxID=35572 RepID=A0A9Q0N841_9DIPT|nr:Alpha-tocopherol transfer protein-like [Pseudolycoriella hygida]